MTVQTERTELHTDRLSSLHDVIVASARAALSAQREDGSMPPGHNGPYRHPETPVRNTSHWTITFLKAHEISREDRFEEAVRRAAKYLMDYELRPDGYTFLNRKTPGKDVCNGVIGGAWAIESLVAVGDQLGIPDAIDLASQVFLANTFDEEAGLWRIIETDGRDLGFDLIFNHQLWFAAAGGLLAQSGNQHIAGMVHRFLDRLDVNMALYSDGLIRHMVNGRSARESTSLLSRAKIMTVRFAKRGKVRTLSDDDLRYRALGYHSFILYAFGMLARAIPDHPLWRSETISKIMRFVQTDSYLRNIDQNIYGYPYNPPGFEIPYAMGVFTHLFSSKNHMDARSWISEQLRRCFDHQSRQMSNLTTDPLTQSARIYEATRLADVSLTPDSG